jgi:hypothetical protein
MTAAYWEIGRRIVESEQGGVERAAYGEELMRRLASDLRQRFGRGFSLTNLKQFKKFYLASRDLSKGQTVSGLLTNTAIGQTPSDLSAAAQSQSNKSGLAIVAQRFPLPWSHYVRLLKVNKSEARRFYETEALRGGWSVRQLDRQISTLFYERTLASRNKSVMLKRGAIPQDGELLAPEQEIKDPFVLEFLGLKDEYSEADLEEAYRMNLPDEKLLAAELERTQAALESRRLSRSRNTVKRARRRT